MSIPLMRAILGRGGHATSLPPENFDQRVGRLRTASDQSWSLAQQRESIIRELLSREGSMGERLAAAAEVLGVSPRTVRRLVGQYQVHGAPAVAEVPGGTSLHRAVVGFSFAVNGPGILCLTGGRVLRKIAMASASDCDIPA